MKKYIVAILLTALLTSCLTLQNNPIERLTMGMSKNQVYATLGPPSRLLEAGYINGQYLEVLEYRINRDVYALEFWNDYLTRCEFLYEEYGYYYAPPAIPPSRLPGRGRPIIIVRPPINNTPSRPSTPSRPDVSGQRPSTPNTPSRPDVSGQRPSTPNTPSRPDVSGQRPSTPTTPSRPNNSGQGSSGSGSGSTTSRPESTGGRVGRDSNNSNNTESATGGRQNSSSSSRSDSSDSTPNRSSSSGQR